MSLNSTIWAMDRAPVKNPTGVLVLVALGDEARDDGTGACPYIQKIMARARCSERSAQNWLKELYRLRLIDKGDPAVARQRYNKSTGRAPRVWNINMAASWENVPEPRTDEEMAFYADEYLPKKPRKSDTEAPGGGGVQKMHLTDNQAEPEDGVQDLHPSGVQQAAPLDEGGVQIWASRGAENRSSGVQPAAPFPLIPEDLNPTNLPLREQLTVAREDAVPGEADPKPPNPDSQILNAAVDAVLRKRQRWTRTEVVAAMRTELDRGRSAKAVADAIVHVANDPQTDVPGRIKGSGPWWGELDRPEVKGPVVYLDRGTPRCGTHPSEPADGCGRCKADRLADDDGTTARLLATRMDASSARAAARLAARSGATSRRLRDHRASRSALAALAEATSGPARQPVGDTQPMVAAS